MSVHYVVDGGKYNFHFRPGTHSVHSASWYAPESASLFGSAEAFCLLPAFLERPAKNGASFNKEGDHVSQGQKIMEIDIDQIREAGFSPMVITVDLV